MKKGDIIRPIGKIGRYIRITDVHKKFGVFGIYLSKVGNISEETRIPEHKYEVLKVYKLSVSKEEFERISRYSTSIIHEATSQWDGLIDFMHENGIDLVMFYNGKNKIYYTIDGVQRVFAFIMNKYKTRGQKRPCIRIHLGNIVAIERTYKSY